MLSWLLKAGGYTAVLRVIATAMTLVFVSAMSLWMPAADFGVMAMVIAIATLAAAVGGFGQSEQIVRDVPLALATQRTEEAAALIRRASHRVALVAPLPATVAGGYFIWAGQGVIVGACAFVMVIALSFNLAWSGAARSYGRYLWALAPKDIFWRAGALVLAAVVMLLGLDLTIKVVMLLLAGSLALSVAAQGHVLQLRPRQIIRRPRAGQGDWLTGFALMLSVAAYTAQSTLDVFLIGAFMSPEAAAAYFPANRIALVAGFFFIPFQLVISPRLSRLVRGRDIAGAQRLNTLGTGIVAIAAILVAILLILTYDLYSPAFGTANDTTRRAIEILVMGQVGVALMGFPGVILIAADQQNLMARVNIGFFVLGTLALCAAAASGSIEAVALTAVLGLVGAKLALTCLAAKHTGILPIHLPHTGSAPRMKTKR